ncbi:tristetraprolin-like [Canna indica]|uniref:Tristetraprolin-like n=1 Tax=Canna indica TaxID=4628 RepID=A0AAQ3K8G4_9LILI|nr:tristetraprolin-like [Canna indica]
MENLGIGFEGSGGGDLTVDAGALGAWIESSSIRRRRFSSPSPSAYLAPAFDACAVATPLSSDGGSSGCSIDFDASLLRYTRSGSYHSSTDSSDLRSTSTRRRLQRLLQLRPSLSSLSSSSSRGSNSSIPPLSPIENLLPVRSSPMYMTPVKVEVGEDVMVMDGVLVSDAESSSGRGLYKTEVCRSWEENGICRYGSKCQFAHGKEELHSVRPIKHKSELSARRSGRNRSPLCSIPSSIDSATSEGTNRTVASTAGTDTQLTKEAECLKVDVPCHVVEGTLDQGAATELPKELVNNITPCKELINNITPCSMTNILTVEIDGKQLVDPISSPSSLEPLFQWPPTESEDAQINMVLYGPCKSQRLPVFSEICSE